MARRLTVKQSFVAGVLLLAPAVVTVYVLRLLAGWTIALVDPLVSGTRLAQYTANNVLAAQVVAVVAILAAVTAVGALAQWSVGRQVFGSLGRAVNVIPLVDTLYSSVRQVATALVEGETRYERVVLVEYPREGLYCIGLVTSSGPPAAEPVTGGDAVAVYLPNSPNPTGGKLLLMDTSEVHEVDMTVRRGLHFLVTTGMGSEAAAESADLESGGSGAPSSA